MPRYATDRATLERECRIEFVRDSGPGGQHRNRRETGVRLFHPPSGVTVVATERRSQSQNLEAAFERLIERLGRLNRVRRRRIPTRTPASAVRERLRNKRTDGLKKALRRPPSGEE